MGISSLPSTKKDDRDELKEALDTASQQTRNLMITFLFFILYVGVTAAGTTHKDLLFPDSTVKMPILGVDIPLFGFYIAAPFLLLVFHFNLLFNLFQHAIKLSKWRDAAKGLDEARLYLFLFNYADKYPLVRFATWIIAFGSPLFLFLFIQVRFLPYHSLGMTLWHQTAVLIDIFLLSLFWQKIRSSKPPDLSWTYFKKTVWKEILSVNMVCLVFVTLFCLKIAVIPPLDESYKKSILEEVEENAFKKWATEFSMFIGTGQLPLILLNEDKGLLKFIDETTKDYYEKNLVLREKELVAKPPSDTIIAAYLRENKSVDEAWMDHAIGINLSNRDLRYADFFESKLIKADLRKANLQKADLEFAKLQGANLRGTSLKEADLRATKLQGAILNYANLQGAKLNNAKLQGAILNDANLQGVNLSSAKLQGAILGGVDLQGTDLSSAHMNGALLRYLGDANLQGTILSRTHLYGVWFPQKEYLTGILANSIYNIVVDWQNLIDEIAPTIPKERREEFKQLMENAKERTAKPDYKPPFFDTDKEGFVSRTDFISIRKKLACENKIVAKGMFNKPFITDNDVAFTTTMREVAAHMKKNCPKNITDDIGWREMLFDLE